MFTGIVAHVGKVADIEDGDIQRLSIDAGPLADLEVGDSLAVNGVCLTAVVVEPPMIGVDVVGETRSRSALDDLRLGDPVNLERPVTASGRFDGHLVQGHVDGVGVIQDLVAEGLSQRARIQIPAGLERYVVEKGSIAVDGVSLTISAVGPDWIEIALIPHTLDATNLGLRSGGDRVNLEVDILAKYVEKLLKAGT